MAIIRNASPQTVYLGTDDQSTKELSIDPIVLPTHLPKFYGYFQKGDLENNLVDGGKLLSLYGEESFNLDSKYYGKHLDYMKAIVKEGNLVMVKRLLPTRISGKANVSVYLDVAQTSIPVYKRNLDGSIVIDELGNKVEDTDLGPVDGYKVKIIKEIQSFDINGHVGLLQSKPGTIKNSDGDIISTMYPVLEIPAAHFGEWYNNIGIGIELALNSDVSDTFLNKVKALPYELYLYNRESGNGLVYKDLYKSTSEKFVFKNNAKDPVTNLAIDLATTAGMWSNSTDLLLPLKPAVIEEPYVYVENLELVNNRILEVEKEFINKDITVNDGSIVNSSEWFDFIDSDVVTDQTYLLNIFNGYSTKRVPYFGMEIDESPAAVSGSQEEITLAYNLPFYLGGGDDGDTSYDSFQTAMGLELDKYLDPDSEVMDNAVNVENIMYDTGYDLWLKNKLFNFITVRKDTFVVVGTRQNSDGKNRNDIVTDRAVGINLKSRASLSPESVFFGTGVARALVVMGDARKTNSLDNSYYSLTYDVAVKAAKMMGGPKWKKVNIFDSGHKNIIGSMYDINPKFIPQGVKPALWNLGLVYPQPYDTERYHFPAMQTIYENDTSVLNSFFTGMAITNINQVAGKVQRYFTGNTELTPAEFIEAVEDYANDLLDGMHAGVVKIIPKAIITDFDEAAGFSWTLAFKLGANVPRTVMKTYTVAMRMDDL